MTWILGNPLLAGLIALLLAVGTYTTILKGENYYLEHRVAGLEAAEKTRDKQVVEAVKQNKLKIEAGKARVAILEKANIYANIKNKAQVARIDELVEWLRDTNGCAVPPSDKAPEVSGSPATGELPRPSGDILAKLAAEYASLAASAEVVRLQAQTCKAHVENLE